MLPSTRLPARINRPEKPGTGAIHFVLWLGTLLAVGVTLLMGSPGSTANSEELIVCGWDEVFVLDTSRQPAVKTWSWKAADRSELPEEIRPKLKTTDDCKPVDGGRRILITSSSGAVALVERASKKALFYASVINAHSAEMLPAGRVIVPHRPTQLRPETALFCSM